MNGVQLNSISPGKSFRALVGFVVLSVGTFASVPALAQGTQFSVGAGTHQGKVRIQLVGETSASDIADATVVMTPDRKISVTTNVGCGINTSLPSGGGASETFFDWLGSADLLNCVDSRFNFSGGSLIWQGSGYEDIIIVAAGSSPSGTIMLSGTMKRVIPIPQPPKLPDYTGAWYNPQESGWGMSVVGFPGNAYGMILYHFDAARQPVWYFHSGVMSGTTYTTTLRYLTGPYFGSGAFDMLSVRRLPVGTITMNFQSATQATLSYTINGVTVNKNLVKLDY